MKNEKSEQDIKKRLFNIARNCGCEDQLTKILNRYEELLKYEKDPQVREQLGILGVVEIHKLLGLRGELVCNGKLILPAQKGYENQDQGNGRIKKID